MLANNPSVLTGGGVATNVVNGTFQLIGPTGSIALTAQGTNQNITLNASGANGSIVAGPIGTGSFDVNCQNGFGNASILRIVQIGVRAWSLTNTATNGYFTISDGGGEYLRLLPTSGTLLLGTTTDSSNGRLQLATHTTSAGGIGFGTETSLYRNAAGSLVADYVGGSSPAFSLSANGTVQSRFFSNGSNTYLESYANQPLILRSNQTIALTLDTSQNATFAGIVIHKSYTVATLPAAAAGNTYGTTFVSDATNAAGTGIGTAPTGGGAVKRAVYSTGAAWLLL